jgi:hypothetical protein
VATHIRKHSIFPLGRTTKSTALTIQALAVLMAARYTLYTTATIQESSDKHPATMRYHTFPHHHPPWLVALSLSSKDRRYHTAVLYTPLLTSTIKRVRQANMNLIAIITKTLVFALMPRDIRLPHRSSLMHVERTHVAMNRNPSPFTTRTLHRCHPLTPFCGRALWTTAHTVIGAGSAIVLPLLYPRPS